MTERVGLVAELDIGQFNRNYKTYIDSIQKMNAETLKTVTDANRAFTQFGTTVGNATRSATPGIEAVAVASKEMRQALANAIPVSDQLKARLQEQRTAYGILSAEIDEMRQRQGASTLASEKQALVLQKVKSRLQEQKAAYNLATEELRQLVEKQNASSVASQQQALRLERLKTTIDSLKERQRILKQEVAELEAANKKDSETWTRKSNALDIVTRRVEENEKAEKLLKRQIRETTEQHEKGTGAVNKKILAVEKLKAKLDEQQKSYELLERQISEATQRQEAGTTAVQRKQLALQKLDGAIKQTEAALRKSTQTTETNTEATRRFDQVLEIAYQSVKTFSNALLSLGIGFASRLGSLGTAITTNLVNGFKNAGTAALEFGSYLNDKLLTTIKRVGLAAGVAAIAMIKMGKDPVSAAAEVEAQLSRVQAVIGLTKDQAGFLKDAVMELGIDPRLVVTTKEAADIMEVLAKNGIFAGKSLQEMEAIALDTGRAIVYLANSTGADFAQATDIATDVMLMFNKRAEDMEEVVAGIIGVTTNSKFTIHDYELALRNGGAAAASFGVALEDFNTIIALTAEETGRGRRAGTGFANVMYRLVPITEEARVAMRQLGIITADGSNRFFDAQGNMQDFSEVVKVLNETFVQTKTVIQEVSKLTPAQQKLLAELKVEYSKAEKVIDEYTNGVKSLTASEEVRNKKIAEAQAIIDSITPKMQELSAVESDWIKKVIEMSDAQEIAALRTIFGREALSSVIGLMQEGAPILDQFTDRSEAVAEVINMIGVSQEEANKMLDEGVTYFDLMRIRLEQIDPEEMARVRMENLKGSLEKLNSVIETLWIKIGNQLLPVMTDLVRKITEWLTNNKELQAWLEGVSAGVAAFIAAISDGEGLFDSFIKGFDAFSQTMRDTLSQFYIDEYEEKLKLAEESGKTFGKDLGEEGLRTANQRLKEIGDSLRGVRDRLLEAKEKFDEFMEPILAFVEKYGPQIKTALRNMGKFIGGLMVASGVAKVIGLLFNPVARLVAIVGILGTAWNENWGGIRDRVEEARESLTNFLDELGLIDAFESGGILGVFTRLQEIVKDIDWSEVGENAKITFLTALGNWGETIGETVVKLRDKFLEFVQTTDWVEVGETVVNAIFSWADYKMTQVEGLFEFFKGLITGGDDGKWGEVGGEILVAIWSGLLDFETGVWNVVEPWKIKIEEYVAEVDWAEVGLDIVTAIVVGLWNFDVSARATLESWYNTFSTWVEETDWLAIGVNIVGFAIEGLLNFVTEVWTTLASWEQAFLDWLETIDWEKLGYDITTWVLEGLYQFVTDVGTTLDEWFTAIKTWNEDPEKWKTLATYIIEQIKARLEQFWEDLGPTFNKFWEDVKAWFTEEKDWNALGQSIIDGLIAGISSKLEAAKTAILGVANGVSQAWNDFWATRSPSRKMMESAQNIMEGANIGFQQSIPNVSQTLENAATTMFSSFLNRTNDILPFSGNRNPVQNVNNTTTRNITLNNNFAGNPQITDANQLELMLAGYI